VDDRTLIGLITFPGLALIFLAFDVLASRMGRFNLMSGERTRQFRTLAVLLVAGLAVSFGIPLFGSSFQTLTLVLSLAVVAYLVVTRDRRARRFAARPPEERIELERRVAFARSPRGIALIAASLVVAFVWSIGAVIVVSSLTP
jgi:uncharacterized membrane protein